jgi:hypothetical protein
MRNKNDEYDKSYHETTAHAKITCRCGKAVWYGCSLKHSTRPKFCKDCTEEETAKIREYHSEFMGGDDIERMIFQETRRVITR